jgi:alkylation response protein AidB-like acyl-CoA dehydrogenase
VSTISAEKLAPYNSFVDANEPQFVDGQAFVPEPVHKAIDALSNAGFLAAMSSEEVGGLQVYSCASRIRISQWLELSIACL